MIYLSRKKHQHPTKSFDNDRDRCIYLRKKYVEKKYKHVSDVCNTTLCEFYKPGEEVNNCFYLIECSNI